MTIEAPAVDQSLCESEPFTPPSLVDGALPGDPVIEEQEPGRIVRWGSVDSSFALSQLLGFPLDTFSIDNAVADGRAISEGGWQAAIVPVGDPPISEISIYLRNTSDGCLRVYNVGPGLYTDEAETLAQSWVTALSTGEPVEPPNDGELGFGYFGRRRAPFEPSGFELDELDPAGAVVRTLDDTEVASLFPTLNDGTHIELQGNPSPDRCTNRPLVAIGGETSDVVVAALSEARSITVAPDDAILATRDVCPAGTRWGDPGTYSELLTVDPAAENPSAVALRTWQSDPEQIVFEDDDSVIALGEGTVADVSPDGRHLSVRENYASDASRWELLELTDDAAAIAPASGCEQAGSIVGPPRFVSDNIVVVARLCSPLHTGEDPDGNGEGDVQIEAVDLGAEQPGNSIVWNGSVPGLGVNEFTRTVDLSARRADDGTIWAIMSGNGGLDVSSQTYALHESTAIDITRIGYQTFAFQAADLITAFDTPPT